MLLLLDSMSQFKDRWPACFMLLLLNPMSQSKDRSHYMGGSFYQRFLPRRRIVNQIVTPLSNTILVQASLFPPFFKVSSYCHLLSSPQPPFLLTKNSARNHEICEVWLLLLKAAILSRKQTCCKTGIFTWSTAAASSSSSSSSWVATDHR